MKIELKDSHLRQIKEICDSLGNDPGELITILHRTQNVFGYLPKRFRGQ